MVPAIGAATAAICRAGAVAGGAASIGVEAALAASDVWPDVAEAGSAGDSGGAEAVAGSREERVMAMAEAVTSSASPLETRLERPAWRRIRSSMTIKPISMSWRTNRFRLRMPGAASRPEIARKSMGFSSLWILIRKSSTSSLWLICGRLSGRSWPGFPIPPRASRSGESWPPLRQLRPRREPRLARCLRRSAAGLRRC